MRRVYPVPMKRSGSFVLGGMLLIGACAAPRIQVTDRPETPARAPRIGVVPPPGPYAPDVDALHYAIAIQLPDSGRRIRGTSSVRLLLRERRDSVRLDFTGLRATWAIVGGTGWRTGMGSFRQDSVRIHVALPAQARTGDTITVQVGYEGEPADGLIIRRNVHGEWGAFGDNWPDRARFWIPAIDHPSDKATVEFEITAPAARSVVANGTLIGVSPVMSGTASRVWRWRMEQPIPTYLMVIGAARFSRVLLNPCARGGAPPLHPDGCVPVSWYAFPQDSVTAATIFRRADGMLEFYSRLVAPFPYPALAHVQSATRFGGMENAGAIFYSDQAINRGTLSEGTVAHEIAHQWFGDAVTPGHWGDLWLSEGFATYFGLLFFQRADGEQRFREMKTRSWAGYLRSDVSDLAIVDTMAVPNNNLLDLLNANSYQKGGAVLHMLRGILGDSVFFRGVRRYYNAHLHGNARTPDLRRALEEESGQELGWFFEQWVYRPGHPILNLRQQWDAASREAIVTVEQVQRAEWPVFRFPLELSFTTPAGETRRTMEVSARTLSGRTATVRIPLPAEPSAVMLDPDGWLLHALADKTTR